MVQDAYYVQFAVSSKGVSKCYVVDKSSEYFKNWVDSDSMVSNCEKIKAAVKGKTAKSAFDNASVDELIRFRDSFVREQNRILSEALDLGIAVKVLSDAIDLELSDATYRAGYDDGYDEGESVGYDNGDKDAEMLMRRKKAEKKAKRRQRHDS